MAKINITVDTESNEYEVSVNGEKLTNLSTIEICFPNKEYYGDYGPDNIMFCSTQHAMSENKVMKMIRTCAAEKDYEKDDKTGLYMKSSIEPSKKSENVLKAIFKC